jgi:hypothetical protein
MLTGARSRSSHHLRPEAMHKESGKKGLVVPWMTHERVGGEPSRAPEARA